MNSLGSLRARELNWVVALQLWLAASVLLAVDASFTVFFRQRTRGNIFALSESTDTTQEIELEGSADAPRFVALGLSTDRVYWSDHRSIRSAFAADGTNIRTEIGTLIRVRWFGVNFDTGGLQLSVLGTPCVSVSLLGPTSAECFVGVPLVDANPTENDCLIQTNRGDMRGVALNSYDEMRASGLCSPVVERIDIQVTSVVPQALAIDTDKALYWSNAADGVIYRSSLKDTAIHAIQMQAWGVKGLALVRWSLPVQALEILFSVEGSGVIRRTKIAPDKVFDAETVLSDLHSPRGLSIDPAQKFLYFTERTGRIYRSSLAEFRPMVATSSSAQLEPQLLITLTAFTRLDGIGVDHSFMYWSETNTNVVARASLDSFEREVVVGGTADVSLSWPRSIALRFTSESSDTNQPDLFYTEYTGRISNKKSGVIVNELSSPSLKYLDELLQSPQSYMYFYALE